jgi:hypothetical protein
MCIKNNNGKKEENYFTFLKKLWGRNRRNKNKNKNKRRRRRRRRKCKRDEHK